MSHENRTAIGYVTCFVIIGAAFAGKQILDASYNGPFTQILTGLGALVAVCAFMALCVWVSGYFDAENWPTEQTEELETPDPSQPGDDYKPGDRFDQKM